MILQIWYLLATGLFPVAFVAAKQDYGVGFELTLDYGVASIHFPNGSYAEVAKIEGNPTYKRRMRTADVRNDNAYIAPDTPATVSWQSFRHYLQPWLGGHNPTHDSISRMLKSLKTASESYLEASVSIAEITVPFPITKTFFDTLRSSAKSISITIPATPASPAGKLASIHVYDIGPGNCGYFDPEDPAQAFLTVEYTRSALTALLVYEECGVYDNVRVLHETDVGSQEPTHDRRAKLTTALSDLTKMPVKVDGVVLKSLSNVLLLGESSQDQLLHDVLKDVLSRQEQSGNETTVFDLHQEPVNPVFAGSLAAARFNMFRSNVAHDEV